MQGDLFQTATSSQPDTHANHLVRPGSDEARKMTVTSGRKYLPLCKQSGRLGAFSRMFLDTSVWASTKCYLTWKAKATPSNRLLFQLAPSMPRTDETGSGLWPTATTQDNPQVRGQGKTIGTNRGTTLGGAVRMWPTPVADNTGTRKKKYAQGGTPLSLAVQQPQMWPTPDASDRGPRSADLVVNQSTVQRRDSGQKRGMDLQTAAKFFPTPTANEDAAGTPNGKMQPMLGNHPDVRGTTPEEWAQGSLNPAWVEWLMGYPPGWTNLETSQE